MLTGLGGGSETIGSFNATAQRAWRGGFRSNGQDRGTSSRAGSAADTLHDLTEQWTVVSRANGLVIITDSVQWMSARGPTSFSLTSAFAC